MCAYIMKRGCCIVSTFNLLLTRSSGIRTPPLYLPGGQELHPTSHLEAVANEIFYGQRSLPQVLHWEREREDEGWRDPLEGHNSEMCR